MFFSGAFCSAHAQLVVDDIEVAAEFQPHLMQGAGVGEAEFLVQADAGRVAARDDGRNYVRNCRIGKQIELTYKRKIGLLRFAKDRFFYILKISIKFFRICSI